MTQRLSHSQVSDYISGYGYKLISDTYNNAHDLLDVMCDKGHTYKVRLYNFKIGKRCPVCNGGGKYTTDMFIEKSTIIHNKKYNYSNVNYINRNTLVTIICPVHGEFEQKAGNHMNGSGCPKCSNQYYIGYARDGIPLFETYGPKLSRYGVVCKRDDIDDNILNVRCMYCNKWYTPSLNSVLQKIKSIKTGVGELNLYCSSGCKYQCPTYNQKKWPKGFKPTTSREVQPQLRKLVFERDNWTCQKCGTKENLHCHHITGVELNPIESADIDNCITFCKDCHKEVHKLDGCDMKRGKC
jgi:hypothetical protein